MKVILIKDVKGIGRAHTEIETADGYALNFLIPKRLAVPATAGAQIEAQTRRKQVVDRGELDSALLAQNIASLVDAKIVIVKKANEKGHLYDAVDAAEISAAAKSQASIDLPEGAIKLEKPIKELGEFEVPVSAGEVFGKFSITIEAE
jgi:large subunit ribosomal protein L9